MREVRHLIEESAFTLRRDRIGSFLVIEFKDNAESRN